LPSSTHTPTAAEATQALIDAGLQHSVMMRAMPVLRHDIAGPLSVLRMGSMLLKRRLAKGDMTPEQAVERVEQLEEQLGDMAHQMRRLRLWDLQIHDRHGVRALVAEALDLARPVLMGHGIDLTQPADAEGSWSDEATMPHTLLYVVLGAIYHLAEHSSALPTRICIEPTSAMGVCVRASGVRSEPVTTAQAFTQVTAMDLGGLQQLGHALDFAVQVHDGVVTIHPQTAEERAA
jgi:hypothetical protein